MSRAARALSESGIYHIMFRGVNDQNIFLDEHDYEKLAETIADLKADMNFRLYAYCFMENQVHLLLHEKKPGDISGIMKRMLTKYARWFNIKYHRSGALMANRYKSKAAPVDEYFPALVRYIHQNPVKAGAARSPGEYRWSSYNDYIEGLGLADTDLMLGMVSRQEFIAFHEVMGEMEFTVSLGTRKTDDELRLYLARRGIKEPGSVAELNIEARNELVSRLKEEFSERQISRVTGLARGTVARIGS
ncbi:MAG: transposase [Oscillospiraceae bacterium]|nr:transposase [Oscillospiraceae bacterium]